MNIKIQRIKGLIKEKNLTYAKFSVLVGKSEPTVRNWFKETSKIDIDTIEKIAEVLNVSIYYIFYGELQPSINNNMVGNNNNNTQGGVILKDNKIEYLEKQLKSCQELIDELRQRVMDKDELIDFLKNK